MISIARPQNQSSILVRAGMTDFEADMDISICPVLRDPENRDLFLAESETHTLHTLTVVRTSISRRLQDAITLFSPIAINKFPFANITYTQPFRHRFLLSVAKWQEG
jgi:hypothetical protein